AGPETLPTSFRPRLLSESPASMQDNWRNTILFFVCAAAILIGYQFLVLQPAAERRQAAAEAAAEAQVEPAPGARIVEEGIALGAGSAAFVDQTEALARSSRVLIRTPALTGSVSL